MNKQMETFSFDSQINLPEKGKRFLALTSYEAMKSVFNITEKKTVVEFWSQKSIELHAKEVRKRGNQMKIGDNGYELSDFDTRKKTRYWNN